MSLLKKEKPVVPSTLTVIDRASARLDDIIEKRKKANEQSRKNIDRLTSERTELKKSHKILDERIEEMSAHYEKILDETKAEQKALIEQQNVTEADLRSGKISTREFMAVGKQTETIEAEARTIAEAKLEKVRETIRDLSKERYALIKAIREFDEKISSEYSYQAQTFFYELKDIREALIQAGVNEVGVEFSHHRLQQATNDLGLAQKGAPIYSAKSWKVRTVKEAELLILDPILQTKDFESFKKFLDEVRGLDFAELNIFYTPVEFAGRGAGSFWFSTRPKGLST